jgi:putative SOS response-associated peptidase YedK
MKTLVLVFLSWAASANAQSFPIVIACFGTPTVCAQKIGGTGMTITAGSDHTNPERAVASALPQESQVLLANNFRWGAPSPLAKVPQIPVMIARNEKAKQGSHWGKPVERPAQPGY